MYATGFLDSAVRMVKVFIFLLLLPVVFTVRRLQFRLQLEEVVGGVAVGTLFLISLLAGSAVVFLSSLAVIQRLNLRH